MLVSPSYWEQSRSHRYSLVFALPLLLLYETLEALAPVRLQGGVVRNGADVVLTGLFTAVFGARGPLVLMALVIGGALVLIWRDRRAGPIRPGYFVLMLAESAVLALLVGVVVGVATVQILGPLRSLAAGAPGLGGTALQRLTLSLGAGLYEELLFRVVLVALISNGVRLLGFSRVTAGVVAVLVGALLFSLFHYAGALGERFRLDSFVFRTIAGLVFSILYLTRGFGITAWTHALYDVVVLLG
ncbi:MAG: CPBP family intramembrane metalloprotease [Gemmatimonadaceae bacterium]|nr:CPBP family intramembrane metalloprotease [Gemmatimonadaceae bacterium]